MNNFDSYQTNFKSQNLLQDKVMENLRDFPFAPSDSMLGRNQTHHPCSSVFQDSLEMSADINKKRKKITNDPLLKRKHPLGNSTLKRQKPSLSTKLEKQRLAHLPFSQYDRQSTLAEQPATFLSEPAILTNMQATSLPSQSLLNLPATSSDMEPKCNSHPQRMIPNNIYRKSKCAKKNCTIINKKIREIIDLKPDNKNDTNTNSRIKIHLIAKTMQENGFLSGSPCIDFNIDPTLILSYIKQYLPKKLDTSTPHLVAAIERCFCKLDFFKTSRSKSNSGMSSSFSSDAHLCVEDLATKGFNLSKPVSKIISNPSCKGSKELLGRKLLRELFFDHEAELNQILKSLLHRKGSIISLDFEICQIPGLGNGLRATKAIAKKTIIGGMLNGVLSLKCSDAQNPTCPAYQFDVLIKIGGCFIPIQL